MMRQYLVINQLKSAKGKHYEFYNELRTFVIIEFRKDAFYSFRHYFRMNN